MAKLKMAMEIYKKSVPITFMQYPTKPTIVPSPNAPAIVKFDPCVGCNLRLNSCESVKQRAKRTELDNPNKIELRIIPKNGLKVWTTNRSMNAVKKATKVRNFNLEEVLPAIKGSMNLKKVPDIQ